MAMRNNLVGDFVEKFQQDSVSWGSLALWVCGVTSIVVTLGIFSNFS
jgi:hypothetical protein